MISSDPAIIIIVASPLNESPNKPSMISVVASMIRRKIPNRGASLPVSATIGLPPAHASHVRMLRRWNSEPTA
jgi:hypothetical protein